MSLDKMTNGYKIATIVLSIIVILASVFIGWIYHASGEYVARENECVYNVCANYDVYYYDDYEQICYCFEDEEIVKEEYLR